MIAWISLLGASAVVGLLYLGAGVTARRVPFYSRLLAASTGSRYAMIDGLRGYLAIGVMLHHVTCNWSYYVNGRWGPSMSGVFNGLAPLGVSEFFLITGFLFWGKAIDKRIRP